MDRPAGAHPESPSPESGAASETPGGLAPLRPLSPAWVVISVMTTLVVGAVATSALWMVASSEHSSHVDAIKTGLSIGAGGGGVIALWAAVQRLQLAQRKQITDEYALMINQAHAERVARSTEAEAMERRFTDLYVKAGDQLGSEKATVRLAGLYALERLVENYPMHRQMIVNVICAYLQMPFTPPPASGTDSQATGLAPTDTGAREELRVRIAAQRILHHLLAIIFRYEDGSKEEDADIDLCDAVLVDFKLDLCSIGSADFSNAIFYGPASFARTSFSGSVQFKDAIFHSEASFRYGVFGVGVVFERVKFGGGAHFDGVSFANACFDGAIFAASVKFGGAVFRSGASFEHAAFHGYALFTRVTFERHADFGKAIFGADCRFDDSTIREGASFENAKFEGEAGFIGTTFMDLARFRFATFHAGALFDDAVFRETAGFGGVSFQETPSFLGANFHGTTQFDNADFRSDAGLHGALVHDESGTSFFMNRWPPGWKAVAHPTRENVRFLARVGDPDDAADR